MDQIMTDQLNNLIKNRQNLVEALRKNDDKSHELLAEGLYKKRAHFITELLQNAEDEGAKIVSFKLTETALIFSHDSNNLFDFNDIKSISNFGDNQKKKDKSNAIGRFGIGFKSVYSITDAPRIVSGNFDITIRDMCIPENNNHECTFFKGTEIILPLRIDNKEEIEEFLENEFKRLDVLYLLFLSNIEIIEWETKNSKGKYKKIPGDKKQFISLKSDDNNPRNYIVFSKPVQIESKSLVIKIAFLLNEDKKNIIACERSPLFAFFPTTVETNLNFFIHAPFHTTESRETLDDSDDKNDILQQELGKLLAEKLSDIKALNYFNVNFLNILPIDAGNCPRNSIYKIFFNAITSELMNDDKKYLPIIDKNEYCSANDTMLLGSSELAGLLTEKQAKSLFGRSYWITSEITETKTDTKKLYQYLHETLSIPDYDLSSFAGHITEEFLLNQSNNWLVKFYKTMYIKADSLWKKDAKNPILRKKPIIRIEKDGKSQQIIPFAEDGKPVVYLPVETKTNYCTVSRSIANDKEVEKFLKAFGIDYPDIFAEINEFILPKFTQDEIYDGYLDDIDKIISVPETKSERRSTLFADLKKSCFLLAENKITNKQKLMKYNEVYFPNEELISYFENNANAYFVSPIPSFNDEQNKKYFCLLRELGVEDQTPKRIEFVVQYSYSEKKELVPRYDRSTRPETWNDYKLDGLDTFLKSEKYSIDKSLLLWDFLSKQSNDFFKGSANLFYYSSYNESFDSKFIRDLRKEKWIVIDDKRFAPHEITFEDLPQEYKSNPTSAKKFSEILRFKLDDDKEYERTHEGKKIINQNEWTEYQNLKAEKELEKSKKDTAEKNIFKPSIKAEDAPVNIETFKGTDTKHPYDKNQAIRATQQNEYSDNNVNPDMNTTERQKQNDDKSSDSGLKNIDSIAIGKWGEEYIAKILVDEYKNENGIEIIDLNAHGKTGVGADFEIRKGDEIIKLIEVKTTTDSKDSPVIVSGTQWETARDFYHQNEGDKYWIYCVYNAGKPNVIYTPVQNPIKQWRDGKIIADPINFILKEL
jgi:hypothetical protein